MRAKHVAGLAIAVAIALGSAVNVQGQASPIYAFLDGPAEDSIVGSQVVIAGWAFNCQRDGQQPFGLRVLRSTNDPAAPLVEVVVYRWSALARPDVAAHFNGHCGAMNQYTGFAVMPFHPIPPGNYNFVFEFSDSMGATYIQRRYTVQ